VRFTGIAVERIKLAVLGRGCHRQRRCLLPMPTSTWNESPIEHSFRTKIRAPRVHGGAVAACDRDQRLYRRGMSRRSSDSFRSKTQAHGCVRPRIADMRSKASRSVRLTRTRFPGRVATSFPRRIQARTLDCGVRVRSATSSRVRYSSVLVMSPLSACAVG
jgi:hypothetical protein